MGKIIYLMGKSSAGKDTIYKALCKELPEALKTIVPYTTRPIRAGEENGVEYYFTDEEGFQRMHREGRVIESREYHTIHGIWRYFTVDDGQIDLERYSYIVIGTLESYCALKAYFGEDKLLPILIELDDGVRLQRALDRERQQQSPGYEEMCRRFLADSQDFSRDKMQEAGLDRTFYNGDLQQCLGEIREYLKAKGCLGQTKGG